MTGDQCTCKACTDDPSAGAVDAGIAARLREVARWFHPPHFGEDAECADIIRRAADTIDTLTRERDEANGKWQEWLNRALDAEKRYGAAEARCRELETKVMSLTQALDQETNENEARKAELDRKARRWASLKLPDSGDAS